MSFVKGRRFENYVKDKLERNGYYVARSAGSKGVFDLIAVKDGKVIGIQCKLGRISKSEIEKIISTAKKYGITPFIATKKNGRVVIEALSLHP